MPVVDDKLVLSSQVPASIMTSALPATTSALVMPKDQKLQYIVKCLEAGFTQVSIAESMGVSESLVSQLVSENSLDQIAAQQKIIKASIYQDIDASYNEAEKFIAEKLKQSVRYMTDPVKIAYVADKLNKMKRRALSQIGPREAPAKVVVLNLPRHVQNNFIFNSQNEAIAVDGRPLVSMPATRLMQKLKEDSTLEMEDEQGKALADATFRISDIL